MFKFTLGEYKQDKLTHFAGHIIARCEYEHGNSYLITEMAKDGHPVEWWVPENRLVDQIV